MRLTVLTIAPYLAVYVSGAVLFRKSPGPLGRKRQGFLEGLWLPDPGTTTTPVHLPTTSTSTAIPSVLVPHDSIATTNAFLPDLGDDVFLSTTIGSSTSPMISPAFTSSPSRTRTSSSSTVPVTAVLSTPSGTSVFSSSVHSTSSDTTSGKPTAIPSSTLSASLASASSVNSTWKTVGISVSVVTLIGLTILLVVFYEQWTAFVRDVFLCGRSRHDEAPLGDEDFLPDKHYEPSIGSYNRKWAREIRESARLSNIRYPTDVFYGRGSTLGPGKAGVGAARGRGVGPGEFGQLDRPSRPSFLQRLSMLSLRASSPVSPRLRTNSHSPGIGKTGDGFANSTLSPPKMSTF